MMDMLIDSVLTAFLLGGIVGAVAALGLQSGKAWRRSCDADDGELRPLRVRAERQRRR